MKGSWRRGAAAAVAAAVAGVVLWPAIAHPDRDGFPLSTYPMFSTPRDDVAELSSVVGIDTSGAQRWLDPRLINGTREVVEAAAVVDAEIGAGEAPRLCAAVAERVRQRGGDVADLDHLEVVSFSFDAVGWFGGRREPLTRDVHASCPVTPA